MTDAGLIVIVALVSPFRADRLHAASLLPAGRFVEIFVDTPMEICRQRDTKGLHALADKGRLANLTGRDQPYEPPEQPALVLETTELSAAEAAERVVALVLDRS
jgi:bifunctional enzyme CysN/CysC